MARLKFQVGAKQKLVRSLAGLKIVQRRMPNLAAQLCNPESALAREFTIDFHGFRYRGEIKNRIDWCVYFLKNYAAAEASLVRSVASFVKRKHVPFVCYDIGASVGHFTLAMAGIADQVVAVEPAPRALSRLIEKIKTNRIRNIKAFEVALDDQNQKVQFEILSAINLYVRKKKDGLTRGAFGSFSAVAKRGDDLIEQNRLPLPNFIRINAADDAAKVLAGLSDTLRRSSPVVLLELPRVGHHHLIDEDILRSALYDDVELFSFRSSLTSEAFVLDPFDLQATKIVCVPAAICRNAQIEACRQRGAGLDVGGV